MDQATTNGPYTLEQGESSTFGLIARDQDTLSQALRQGQFNTMDDIARLAKEAPTAYDTLSSVASTSTMLFTSREQSSVTKPTSVTTSRPLVNTRNIGKGKGKPKALYTASLSGTNGSASGAEAERRDARRNDLLAVGSWANSELIVTVPLKGAARSKSRTKLRQTKKFDIVLTHEGDDRTPLLVQDNKPSPLHNADYRGNMLSIAEAGMSPASSTEITALVSCSRARTIGIVSLFILKTLVLAFAIFAAYSTGEERKFCIKAIVLATSVCMACLTILAMLVARRVVLEALLAGLMELVFGLAILTGLDDFI